MAVRVSLSTSVSDTTAERIKAIFRDAGMGVSVESRLGHKGAVTDASIVIATELVAFLRTLLAVPSHPGTDANAARLPLRSVVSSVVEAARSDKEIGQIDTVTIRDPATSTTVVFPADAPDESYVQLSKIDFEGLGREARWLTWDQESLDWRDALGRELPRASGREPFP